MLICVMGRTCSGKNSLLTDLCKKDNRFSEIVSYASRDMRVDDIDGVTHHFPGKERFAELRDTKELLGYVKMEDKDGNFNEYFTLMDDLKDHNTYIVDPEAVMWMRKQHPELQIETVYIYADLKTREERYMRRNGNMNGWEERTAKENSIFTEYESRMDGDRVIVNQDREYEEVFKEFEETMKLFLK